MTAVGLRAPAAVSVAPAAVPVADAAASGRPSSLRRGGLAATAGSVVGAVAGFAFALVVSRRIGAAGAGVVMSLTTAFTVVVTILKAGTDTTLVRETARLLALGRTADLRRAVGVALLPVLALTVAVAVAGVLAAPTVAARLTADAGPSAVTAARLLALLIPAGTVCAVALAAVRGLGRIGPLVAVEQVGKPVGRLVLAVAAGVAAPGVLAMTSAWAVPTLFGVLAAGWVLVTTLRGASRPALLAAGATGATVAMVAPPRPVGEAARDVWRYSGPRAVAQALEILTLSAGTLMVSSLAGSTEAGRFAVVSRLALAGLLVLQALRLVVAPRLAALLATGRSAEAQRVHQVSSALVLVGSWPLYLAMLAVPSVVLAAFGSDFAPAAPALAIVSLGMLVNTATGNVQSVLLMGGWSARALGVSAVALTVNVVLLLLFVPQHGATGAAVAWAVSVTVENLAQVWLVRRVAGVATFGPVLGGTAAAVVAAVGLPLTVGTLLHLPPVPLLGLGTAGTAVLALLLWRRRHDFAIDAAPVPAGLDHARTRPAPSEGDR